MSKSLPPLSIILVSLWSVGRSLTAVLVLYGTYTILANALYLLNDSLVEVWSAAPLDQKIYIVLLLLKAVTFLISAIGIFRGQNWGRIGFIIASLAVFVWVSYGTLTTLFVWGVLEKLYLPIDSFIALCFALWYFNREETLQYFGAKKTFPIWNWPFIKIGRYPATLIVVFSLGILRLLSEGFGLIDFF